jgi:hypothetical protein
MVKSSQTGSRDLALAFEDARLKFVLSVSHRPRGSSRVPVGRSCVGLEHPAFAVGTVADGATVFALD